MMVVQNFYGTVQQVAGSAIHNTGGEAPAPRRDELLQRAQWHATQRTCATRSRYWNRWTAALGLVVLGALVLLATQLESLTHLAALHGWPWQLPATLVLALVAAFVGWRLDAHRKQCRADWAMHNAAIAEINRVLAVM